MPDVCIYGYQCMSAAYIALVDAYLRNFKVKTQKKLDAEHILSE